MASKSKGTAKNFDQVKVLVDQMKTDNGPRNTNFERREKMYRLELENEPTGEYVKLLLDHLPHTVVDMVVRMYGFHTPRISIPTPSNDEKMRAAADKVERFLRAVFYATRGDKLLQDLLAAVSIYDEETLVIDPWGLEDKEAATPFLIETRNPKFCYAEYGSRQPVIRHAYRVTMRLAQLQDAYGEKETAFLGDDLKKEYTLVDYVDDKVRCVYVEEKADQAILYKSHNWGFVPRQAALANAPSFQEKPEDRRMGILFSLEAAHLWEASSLSLTLANSNVFAFLNPQWVKKSKNPKLDQGMAIRLNETGKVHIISTEESIEVLAKQLIPKEQLELLSATKVDAEAATMPKILAGASPFAGITASATHTLSTNARMIAQPIARSAARALEQAFDIILRIMVAYKKPVQVWGLDGVVEIAASDILAVGERLRVVVELRPDVSMERQVTMQIAAMLKNIGAGYDTIFTLLENAGIITSAEQARQDMLISRFIDVNLKSFAEQAAQEAGVQVQASQQIGTAQPPTTPLMAEEAGGMPPEISNALNAQPMANNPQSLEELNGMVQP